MVTEADVRAARNAAAGAKADLERVMSDLHKAQGALEQVGGAVARERLRDAIEAYDFPVCGTLEALLLITVV